MSYRENLDHFGNLLEVDQPWRLSDLLRVAVAVVFLVGAVAMWVR